LFADVFLCIFIKKSLQCIVICVIIIAGRKIGQLSSYQRKEISMKKKLAPEAGVLGKLFLPPNFGADVKKLQAKKKGEKKDVKCKN
jgi:hypothetical protein